MKQRKSVGASPADDRDAAQDTEPTPTKRQRPDEAAVTRQAAQKQKPQPKTVEKDCTSLSNKAEAPSKKVTAMTSPSNIAPTQVNDPAAETNAAIEPEKLELIARLATTHSQIVTRKRELKAAMKAFHELKAQLNFISTPESSDSSDIE